MLKPVLTVPPVGYPVSLDEIRAQCRIDSTDEDILLQSYIAAATSYLDGYTGILGRALLNQTWRQTFPYFSNCGVMGLELTPVQSITSITYYDTDNAQQPLSNSVYAILEDELGVFIDLQAGQDWPDIYDREDAVTVTYVAGYGSAPHSVPAAIRHAIMLLAAGWYEQREPTGPATASVTELPFAVTALLTPYRRVGL